MSCSAAFTVTESADDLRREEMAKAVADFEGGGISIGGPAAANNNRVIGAGIIAIASSQIKMYDGSAKRSESHAI